MDSRNSNGTFAQGNPGGPGRPAKAVESAAARIRKIFIEGVVDEDLRLIVDQIVTQAKQGDHWAINQLFDRLLGKPVPSDFHAELDELEKQMRQIQNGG